MVYETLFYLPKVCLSDAGGASMDSVQTSWTGGDLTDSLLGCLKKDTLVVFLPSAFSDILTGWTCVGDEPALLLKGLLHDVNNIPTNIICRLKDFATAPSGDISDKLICFYFSDWLPNFAYQRIFYLRMRFK